MPEKKAQQYHKFGVLILVLIGLFLRVWGSSWGLPHLYHPDEDKIVNHALAFGKGDLNPHYFGWPSLQMYLLFAIYGCYFVLGWLLGYFISVQDFLIAFALDPSNLYLLGRWLSALLGGLTVWITYAAGRRLYGTRVGLYGAAFLSVNYLHVKDSHYITPDVPVAFMVMAAFWFAIRTAEEPHLKHYAAAGILTGLAISVKYPAFTAGISLLVAHLIALKTHPKDVRLFSAPVWIAAALIPIAFVVGTPFSVLDWNNFLVDLWHQKINTSRPLPILAKANIQLFENPLLALGIGTYVLAVIGAIRGLLRRMPADVLILSFPAVYLAFMLATGALQHRYLMPILPFACLLAALGLQETTRAVGGPFFLRPPVARLVTALAGVALLAHAATQSVVLDLSLSRPDTRTQAKEWIESNILDGSRVALDSYGPPLRAASSPVPATEDLNITVDEWREHRGKVSEKKVYGKLRDARLKQDWKQHKALMEQERDKVFGARPSYAIVKLAPIPYPWLVRLETGQVTEEELREQAHLKHLFKPKCFLAEKRIEYYVRSSAMYTSPQMKSILERQGDLLHRIDRQDHSGSAAKLPFYSMHNPTLEIYRLRSDELGNDSCRASEAVQSDLKPSYHG